MNRPLVAATREELAARLDPARADGRRIALVPTMGALHEGHVRLLHAARVLPGDPLVVVSVFVNPMQFAPGEDLERYPRTWEQDLATCRREGVDLVFAPAVDEVYPCGEPQVVVDPGPLGDMLEGRSGAGTSGACSRAGSPSCSAWSVQTRRCSARRTTNSWSWSGGWWRTSRLGVQVVGVETVRDPDGLALSSRNRYLDAEQRRSALALHGTLRAAQASAGEGPGAALAEAGPRCDGCCVDLDYLEITGPDLEALPEVVAPGTPARALVAGRVGSTRLIDNLPLVLGPHPKESADRCAHHDTSKITAATVTQADLHYVGSVTVDQDLLDAADLLPGELVTSSTSRTAPGSRPTRSRANEARGSSGSTAPRPGSSTRGTS